MSGLLLLDLCQFLKVELQRPDGISQIPFLQELQRAKKHAL
jgi:hypothetical protein